MAQRFQVLRCCFCNLFQVQQVKKSKKWNCKVCNEKQSILKVFGQGSGSDCRHHVQKLNLLQGEAQQAPVNMLIRDIGEPIEVTDENTVNFKEEPGQQEEKKGTFSRWTKYLDEKSEEQEEEEESSSQGNVVTQTRKRKKPDLYTTDSQRHEKRNVSGFADEVKRFDENSHGSVTASTKCCGDATCKNVLTPDVEVHMVHRKNQDPCSRGAGLSKWDKFLLSSQSCTNDATAAMLQKRPETLVETCAVVGKSEKATLSISISSQQNVANPHEGAEEVDTTHTTLASTPAGRNKQLPSLASAEFQERRLNRVPEETTPTHSTCIATDSSSKTPFRSLFSTGDDFDDYI